MTKTLEHKILPYVDDTVFMLHNLEESPKALKMTLGCFGKVSGYKINEAKSIILGLIIDIHIRRYIQALTVIES